MSYYRLDNERIKERTVELLSIDEAALRMGRHPASVRRLVRSGEMAGQKIGGRWLVREEAIRERSRLDPPRGRPVSSKMAWAVLELVNENLHLDTSRPISPGSSVDSIIDNLVDRRVRFHLRELLADAPPPEKWGSWLRRRASPRRIWVHPGVVERLSSDRRLRPGSEAAAAAAGIGNGAGVGASKVFYLRQRDVNAIVDEYRGRDEDDGQVLLMVVPDEVVSDLLFPSGKPVAAVVALVDMVNSPDSRQRHLATELLSSAVQKANAKSELL